MQNLLFIIMRFPIEEAFWTGFLGRNVFVLGRFTLWYPCEISQKRCTIGNGSTDLGLSNRLVKARSHAAQNRKFGAIQPLSSRAGAVPGPTGGSTVRG
ncbi:MAG: hypothetical protein COB16_13225 [Rhodobacteraceae bacterium]|nr:MAG: hypothetical protein COB16_13225 [Paracoccaceae bacterium]